MPQAIYSDNFINIHLYFIKHVGYIRAISVQEGETELPAAQSSSMPNSFITEIKLTTQVTVDVW